MPLTIHFLNVGHGDCTFIEHPSGRLSMIDINNSTSLPETDVEALAADKRLTTSQFRGWWYGQLTKAGIRTWEDYYKSLLVDPHEYYEEHLTRRSVFRYIQTHPDMDHMSGLYRFFWQEKVALGNVWDTDHTKTFTEGGFDKSRFDWNDWLTYGMLRAGRGPDGTTHRVLNLLQGAASHYYFDDNIEILAPTQDLVDYANRTENWNNLSYVLKITHAGRKVIFGGDAEKPMWDKVEELYDDAELRCDILKAAHHGRESGYSETVVAKMSPDFVICSVGKKPDTDASDEYASHGAKVLSTRYHGSLTATVFDDGSVGIWNHANTLIGSLPALVSWTA